MKNDVSYYHNCNSSCTQFGLLSHDWCSIISFDYTVYLENGTVSVHWVYWLLIYTTVFHLKLYQWETEGLEPIMTAVFIKKTWTSNKPIFLFQN